MSWLPKPVPGRARVRGRRKGRLLPLVGALAAIILAAPWARAARDSRMLADPRTEKPRAVFLITLDALRADAPSFGGGPSGASPFLDYLAESSVVFTQAEATSSWTVPSIASLLTSLEPSAHGLVVPAQHPKTRRLLVQPMLAPSLTTLAETFDRAGYLTIGVPSNVHLRGELGFAQGFDSYFGPADFVDADQLNRTIIAKLSTAVGFRWRERWRKRPTFFWLHYFDPHDPYMGRPPWVERFAPNFATHSSDYPAGLIMTQLREKYPHPDTSTAGLLRPLYQSDIRFLDEQLRTLSDSLGLAEDNVLLIVTADHGEEFAEHGGLGHGNSLYEELTHVPLFLRWPRVLKPGRIDTPVSLMDIYPTLVELLGLPGPSGLRGTSLIPLLEGKRPRHPRSVFSELHPPDPFLLSVRRGEWKLIRSFDTDNRRMLYNLKRDPKEQKDVAAENPKVVEELRIILMEWRNAQPAPPSDLAGHKVADPTVTAKLRALGYIN